MVNAVFGHLSLGIVLEEELVDLAQGQTLRQVIERSVFIAAMVAMAVALATLGETLDKRGTQAIRADLELRQKETFALAQGKSGFSRAVYPSHIYG